ncbi:MAG: hypothetical protein RRE21_01020 [Desulfurococcales archaeon]|nr:hypothetical protein [Desulfurococcales archaeon]
MVYHFDFAIVPNQISSHAIKPLLLPSITVVTAYQGFSNIQLGLTLIKS